MSVGIHLLTDENFKTLDDFLIPYTLTSMFMRSNIRRVGLTFKQDTDFSACYYGVFDHQQLQGVIALNWNSNLFIQVPELSLIPKALKNLRVCAPNFAVQGILGPEDQAQVILKTLKRTVEHFAMSRAEISYDLPLKNLRLPMPLVQGHWHCRHALEKDLDILAAWRRSYDQESLGLDKSRLDTEYIMKQKISDQIKRGDIFVLEHNGQLVSQANYNATLEDTVQIGGVWTPPHLRGRGYAQSVVAGALQAATHNGNQTGILFTSNPIARRVYENLGFQARVPYHLSILKKPVLLSESIL